MNKRSTLTPIASLLQSHVTHRYLDSVTEFSIYDDVIVLDGVKHLNVSRLKIKKQ
jgi:hypothetical protein